MTTTKAADFRRLVTHILYKLPEWYEDLPQLTKLAAYMLNLEEELGDPDSPIWFIAFEEHSRWEAA